MNLSGTFVLIIDGELKTYDNYNDIPENFDHVIKFIPDIPLGPHSNDQHEDMKKWTDLLQKLIEKEKSKNV